MRTLQLALLLSGIALTGCGGDDAPVTQAPSDTPSDTRALDAARAALNVEPTERRNYELSPREIRELAVEPLEEADEAARLRRDRAKAARYEVERRALEALERAEREAREAGAGDQNRLSADADNVGWTGEEN